MKQNLPLTDSMVQHAVDDALSAVTRDEMLAISAGMVPRWIVKVILKKYGADNADYLLALIEGEAERRMSYPQIDA